MAAFSISTHHHYYRSLCSIQAHPKSSGGCLFYSSCFRSPTPKNHHKLPLLTKSFRNHHRSSPNLITTTTTLSQQQEDKEKEEEEEESSRSYNSSDLLLRDVIKLDAAALQILSIALPAAIALLADPLTSLVDTAFVGHLGSVELAAVGVSVSVFSLVSKLFNVPLLNITTSFVAQEQAVVGKDSDESTVTDDDSDLKGKICLPSISTSLALATGLGIAETFALYVGSGFLMNTMGIAADSPMRIPAEQFLTLRAFGAPPIVIALAAQGTFRGFKDTRTPLYAVGAGNILNVMLDLILIFFFNLGITGAAVATVTSEYVNDVVKPTEVAIELSIFTGYLTALILLWKLNAKVELITPSFDWGRVAQYLKSGSLLIARTIGVLITTTLATSMATRGGAVNMAGFQICFEVWLAVSLLTDALALAGQALLASDYSQGSYDEARKVVFKVLQIGVVTGMSLAAVLFLGFGALSSLFTVDSEVLEIARSGTLFVAGSQPINAVAFVLDGLYYGVSDFEYAAYSTVVVGGLSVVFMLLATYFWGLVGVWTGLFFFMSLRVVAGILRLSSGGGPWKFLRVDMDGDA